MRYPWIASDGPGPRLGRWRNESDPDQRVEDRLVSFPASDLTYREI